MLGTSGKRWKLFDLFGHPVYVTPWFLALIALFAFSGLQAGAGMEAVENIAIWAPVLFVGILFHEFGHAFAIERYGFGHSRIILHGFGGVTVNNQRGQSSPKRSIVISLAGPIASLLLGGLFLGAYIAVAGSGSLFAPQGFVENFLGTMALINFIWAAFNLLPINPMDGGHVVLHALRAKMKSPRKAMRYSAISSLVFIGLLVLGTLALGSSGIGLIWILVLAGMFGIQNWRIYKATEGGGGPGMRQRHPGGF